MIFLHGFVHCDAHPGNIFVRANRTYYDIYLLVEKIDKLSLEKKRELTIPLIKEIL